MEKINYGNKLPGKTEFAGRRRSTTRTSGFKAHPDTTGGEIKIEEVESIAIPRGSSVTLLFEIPQHNIGDMIAFGGWYSSDHNILVEVDKGIFTRELHTEPEKDNWSKFGSMMISNSGLSHHVSVKFSAIDDTYLALYEIGCGIVKHRHLEWASNENKALLNNMFEFAPEANFYDCEGESEIVLSFDSESFASKKIYLKSCNRCARFLPINIVNERHHLSFSNHCVAQHRRPCSHKGFGRLIDIDTNEFIQLEYGYQLECRFCKKYEVNAAHNPQRTPAQMKEDGARRRAFELLLTELFSISPQLSYRERTGGRELANDIWGKFKGCCFNCAKPISTLNAMHLDHTRPLALLWPLDETATCLCESCNSRKRDRMPYEFYSREKLALLSNLTGIPLDELKSPKPNMIAVEALMSRLDWLFKYFCQKPELQKVRDGKLTSDLLLKALQKVLSRTPYDKDINLLEEYYKIYN